MSFLKIDHLIERAGESLDFCIELILLVTNIDWCFGALTSDIL